MGFTSVEELNDMNAPQTFEDNPKIVPSVMIPVSTRLRSTKEKPTAIAREDVCVERFVRAAATHLFQTVMMSNALPCAYSQFCRHD